MIGKGGGRGKLHGGRGNGKGGRGAGRGGGGGHGGGGQVILNGVDVLDPNRTFSKEEWNKLRGQWQYIWDKRAARGGANVGGRGHGQGQGGASSLQARQIQATPILSEITGKTFLLPQAHQMNR